MRSDATPIPEGEHCLLRQAAEWRLISILFERPRTGWWSEIEAIASTCADPLLKQAAAAARREATEGLYHSLLGPGGHVSPREARYSQTVQLGYLMSELAAWYRAFGFQPRTAEPADHVSVEAGFVSYLLLKRVYALVCGEAEAAEIAAAAAREFIATHLRVLAGPLSSALDDPPYLFDAARALLDRTGPENRLHVLGQFDPLADPDSEVRCGECPQEEPAP
jgi:TorA maturation chaperone TorD